MKFAIRGSFYVVNTMTVDAGGDIGITLANQSLSVNAPFIYIIDLRVTAFTGLRDLASGFIRRTDIMRAMAIRAHGSFKISCSQGLIVDAVYCGFILFGVAV
jgi:hypothetical protein